MKISYVTNCHNRLWQLKKTLPHNLKYTLQGVVEIVLLVYNDLETFEYITENYQSYIEDGRLTVINHTDAKPYTFGHVKNLAHSYAKGRVVFNLDADNYIDGCHDALLALQDNEILITTESHLSDGRGGRIGMTKLVFKILQGYRDGQRLPDDVDLIERAMSRGYRLKRADCLIAPLKNTEN